jgi:hypothetical protein
LFCIIYIPPDVTHVPPRKSRAKLADRTEHASVPPAVAGQPEGVAVIFRRMPYGTDFERLKVFKAYIHNTHLELLSQTIYESVYRVFLSKPSRDEEAWSFAQAKVPKLNANERSRWNGVSVFAGKGRRQ